MRIPLQLTFREIEPSDAIRDAVRGRADTLARYYDGITSCRVVVEAPHRRHRQGSHYRVRVGLTVPGEELVVGRAPGEHGAHEDVYVAIRDAFNAAVRQLQDYIRRRRGAVKERHGPAHGRVVRVFRRDGFGFLVDRDGREIYFHRNSVVGDFDALTEGTEVRFAEEMGDRGPQASSLVPVGKSGHAAAPLRSHG